MRTAPVALLCALSLTGCRDATFDLPSDDTALRTDLKIEPDQPKLHAAATREAGHTTLNHLLADNTPNQAVSIIGLVQFGLILMECGEANTYTVGERLAGWHEPASYNLRLGHHDWVSRNPQLAPKTGLWLIWPMELKEDTALEMAALWGSDLVRGGSASMEVRRELNTWIDRFSGKATTGDHINLDKSTAAIGLITGIVDIHWAEAAEIASAPDDTWTALANRTEVEGWTVSQVETNNGGYVSFFSHPTGSQIPESVWKIGSQRLDTPLEQTTLPSFASSPEMDLQPLIRELGGSSLFDGPVNMRRIAVEFGGSSTLISGFYQPIALTVDGHGVKTPGHPHRSTAEEKTAFAVFDKDGVCLFVGTN